jgi:hypothetical protein
LKKSLLSISFLEAKGFRVAFVDGQVILCPKNSSIDKATVIVVWEGGLYKLKGHQEKYLVHNNIIFGELWNQRLDHINYRALWMLRNMVTSLLDI